MVRSGLSDLFQDQTSEKPLPKNLEEKTSHTQKENETRLNVDVYNTKKSFGDTSSFNKTNYFKMPLHYPNYTKEDYQEMPEWRLNYLLAEYGLPTTGDLGYKREYAMGAFLWPKAEQGIENSEDSSLSADENIIGKIWRRAFCFVCDRFPIRFREILF